ncbi:hypothetical protein BAL199_28845 [alpha proteobacterium BAL199]|nr:hypothetical protein BAL199_28845 [alpha proteobacterium BAL199]
MTAEMASAPVAGFSDRLAGFDEHWRSIEPELKRIESGRWLSLIGGGVLCVLALPAFVLGIALADWLFDPAAGSDGPWLAGALLGAGTFMIGAFIAHAPSRNAGLLIKERVARFLGFSYQEDAPDFPLGAFDGSDILPSYSGKSLQDHIRGEVSGVPITMCDAELTERRGSGKGSRTVTVFRGPLVVSVFPKPSTGRTIVVPDGGAIGNFFAGRGQDVGQRVKLESPDFERAFEVYSSDQVEARYLLTPAMMERLLAFRARFGSRIRLAFAERELLIAIDDRRDWFPDPGLFQKLTDPALVRDQAEEIARIAKIVETLKLNAETRI